MAEFGGSVVDGNAAAKASMDEATPVPAGTADGIDLEEFQPQPQYADVTDA